MKSVEQVPYYAPDGTSLGFRSMEAAKRLIAGGFVKPSYGRKGHLRAIWARSRSKPAKASRTMTPFRKSRRLPTIQ